MKALFLSLVIFLNLFSLEDPQVLMNSISHHAIRIGDGATRIYTFIDPLCPKSQTFFSTISEDKRLQEDNSYYIFLYRLRKFDSDKLIQYIYQSNDPLSTLTEVMLYHDYEGVNNLKLKQ